jgi:hypothetical protein
VVVLVVAADWPLVNVALQEASAVIEPHVAELL